MGLLARPPSGPFPSSYCVITRAGLLEELGRVRSAGYAIDNEESEAGAQCVGAPLKDHTGRVIAAISISGPASRITRREHARLGEIVREVAERAQRQLGL